MLIIILKYIESWKNIGKYRANYIGGSYREHRATGRPGSITQ